MEDAQDFEVAFDQQKLFGDPEAEESDPSVIFLFEKEPSIRRKLH